MSRTTVSNSYQTLVDEDLLSPTQGSGTKVRENLVRSGPITHGDRLSTYVSSTTPLDLSSGVLPTSPILNQVLRGRWIKELRIQASNDRFKPRGLSTLRDAIATYYDDVGTPTSSNELIVTNGSHHSLGILAACLLEPGDTVLVEEPTYRGALDVFNRRGVRVIGVETDNKGIIPHKIEESINKYRPNLVYVIPTAHNVTGVTWSPERRTQVSRIIADKNVPIIDDGSTADLNGTSHPGYIASELPIHLSITIGSLTKLFWSGLRVGWIRGPRNVLDAALETRITNDIAGSVPSQILALHCFPHADRARQLRRVELQESRQLVSGWLRDTFPGWSFDENQSGACLWVNTNSNAVILATELARKDILLIPGSDFSTANHWENYIRLPLGSPETIERALPVIQDNCYHML